MKEHVRLFEMGTGERVITLTHKRNRNLQIVITAQPDGIITNIEKTPGATFRLYDIGQRLNRNLEVWCCNNNYLLGGKDTCPEEKIFGIPKRYAEQDPRLKPFIKR